MANYVIRCKRNPCGFAGGSYIGRENRWLVKEYIKENQYVFKSVEPNDAYSTDINEAYRRLAFEQTSHKKCKCEFEVEEV